ncbi:hypothetical protein RvY_18647 [Ramazzottius varieornatus]|uniref:Glycoprotein n=1 Tax=Ramazzottius varieornatus TaxID=947166 RepID=A0A1D1W6J7_RAMVA|nr:hypothetical protein RvY_18647 [Ramazzottius varieornatus]
MKLLDLTAIVPVVLVVLCATTTGDRVPTLERLAVSRTLATSYTITSYDSPYVHCDSLDKVNIRACGIPEEELPHVKFCKNSSRGAIELPVNKHDGGIVDGCSYYNGRLGINIMTDIYCAFECHSETRIGAPYVRFYPGSPCEETPKPTLPHEITKPHTSMDTYVGTLSMVNYGASQLNKEVPQPVLLSVTCDVVVLDCRDFQICVAPILKSDQVGRPSIFIGYNSTDMNSIRIADSSTNSQFAHYARFILWPAKKKSRCRLTTLKKAMVGGGYQNLTFDDGQTNPPSTPAKFEDTIVHEPTTQFLTDIAPEQMGQKTTDPAAIATKHGTTILSVACWSLLGVAGILAAILVGVLIWRCRISRMIYSSVPSSAVTQVPSEEFILELIPSAWPGPVPCTPMAAADVPSQSG